MKFSFKLLALAALLGSSSAYAGEVSYHGSFNDIIAGGAASIPVQSFDSSLGTLTGVTIGFSATASGTVSIVNLTPNNISFVNAFAGVTSVTVNGPLGLAGSTGPVVASVPSGVANGWTSPFLPFSVTNLVTTNIVPVTGSSALPATDWSAFIKPPATTFINLAVTMGSASYGGTVTSDNGSLFFGGTSSVSGDAYVIYDYITTPVAEPEQVMMFVLGLPLMTWLARRKQAA